MMHSSFVLAGAPHKWQSISMKLQTQKVIKKNRPYDLCVKQEEKIGQDI